MAPLRTCEEERGLAVEEAAVPKRAMDNEGLTATTSFPAKPTSQQDKTSPASTCEEELLPVDIEKQDGKRSDRLLDRIGSVEMVPLRTCEGEPSERFLSC